VDPPQAGQLIGIDAIALPLATLRPFHQARVGRQHLVSPLGDHVLHPSRVSSYFDHYPRHGQCLEELPYIFLRRSIIEIHRSRRVADLGGSHTKAHDLSGGRQENRCGAKSAMGEVQVEEAA